MRALNIVGCGRAGRTLARLFAKSQAFSLQDLLDLDPAAARACARFAQAGRPVQRVAALRPASVWLVSTPDAAIVETVACLVAAGAIARDNVVVHLSGATPSTDLVSAIEIGAHAGSAHPVKTFADPGRAADSFAGTHVALEGDRVALRIMRAAFRRIGARTFEIEPHNKALYHAGSVIVCNYLTALVEAGLRCYAGAGIERALAYRLMEPLARETLDNICRVGTVRALTGPIARGDAPVVARQLQQLRGLDSGLADVYRELGKLALELARTQEAANPRALARVRRALRA